MANSSPPLDQWVSEYKKGTAQAGSKWVERTAGTSGWQAAAISTAAKDNYRTNVAEAISQGKREKALAKVSDSEWQQDVRQAGAGSYTSGTTNKAPKYAKGAAPVKSSIDSLLGSLPARGPNYAANKARVDHMAQGLEDTFKGGA